MTSVHDITERDLAVRALEHDCPDCGAKASVRCRILRPNVTNPKLTVVDVRRKPCGERVMVAWRATLQEGES
jgi:hypothetical protein